MRCARRWLHNFFLCGHTNRPCSDVCCLPLFFFRSGGATKATCGRRFKVLFIPCAALNAVRSRPRCFPYIVFARTSPAARHRQLNYFYRKEPAKCIEMCTTLGIRFRPKTRVKQREQVGTALEEQPPPPPRHYFSARQIVLILRSVLWPLLFVCVRYGSVLLLPPPFSPRLGVTCIRRPIPTRQKFASPAVMVARFRYCIYGVQFDVSRTFFVRHGAREMRIRQLTQTCMHTRCRCCF